MLNTHHELSQAHCNSFSQNPQDFIDEINLPEDSNLYSLVSEHIRLTTTLYYYSKDWELLRVKCH